MSDTNPFDAIVAGQQAAGENPFDAVVSGVGQGEGTANPFDSVVAEGEKRRQRQQFLETLQRSKGIVPERQARAMEVAKLRGVPVGVAYQYLDELAPKPDAPDYDSMTHKAPATAKLLADPLKGPVAFPDAQPLADLEEQLKEFSRSRGLDKPPAPLPLIDQFLGAGASNLTPEQQKAEQDRRTAEAAAALKTAQERQRQADIVAAQRQAEREQDPTYLYGGKNYNPESDLTRSTARAETKAAEGDLARAQSTPPTQTAAAAYVNTIIRTLLGSVTSAAQGGSAMADSLDYWLPIGRPSLDKNGRSTTTQYLADLGQYWGQLFPEDPGRARDLSMRTTEAVTSAVPFVAGGAAAKAAGGSPGWVSGLLGALQQAGQGEQDAVDHGASVNTKNLTTWLNALLGASEAVPIEALFATVQSGRRSLMQFLSETASNAAIEAGQNTFQQLSSDTWARLMYDPTRDVAGNSLDAAKMGGLVGGLFGAAASLTGSASEAAHGRLLALGEAVKKTRISEIAPEILDEHIAGLKKAGAAPEHVTAPAPAVETLFQELDPDALAAQFPGTVKSLREAMATGAEVTIPTEELVRLGKLKGYKDFAADVRVGEEMTLNEAVKLRSDVQDFVAKQDPAATSRLQEESPVFKSLRDQLLKAGQTPEVATAQARLIDAFFTAQSERTGVPVTDLARRYHVEVTNSAVAEAAGQTTLYQDLGKKPPVTITVAASRYRELPPAEARAAAEKDFSKNLRGSYTNADTGWSIEVTKKSVSESLHGSGSKVRAEIVANLPALLERAVLAESHPDAKKRQNVSSIHRFYAPLQLDGRLNRVKLTVREFRDGAKRHYAVDFVEMSGPDVLNVFQGKAAPEGATSSARTPSDPVIDIASFLGDLKKLYQKSGSDVRGSITFTPLRDKFRITLTEKANLSTFLHEGGHFFLEVLQDLVQRGEASAQQVADLTTLKTWMGLADGKGKAGPAQAIDRAGHEKFARSFEQYLMEGKAPSLALHGIFQKFKAWLIFVYKRLANVRGDLNDEVRTVMDRLVASDAAIAEARAMVGWRGNPLSQEEVGLSDAEYKAYVGAWTKANDAQSADADARIMLEAAREMRRTWAEEKAKVTKEIEAEIHATRGYKAWKLLESGEGLQEVRPGWSDMKIDPASIPSGWKAGTSGMTAPAFEGGLPLDLVAETLGFDTGEQMLQLIGGAKLAQKAVPLRVRQIMAERHGEMDQASLAREAMKAVHNTPTMDVLLTEFRALAAKANLKAGSDTKRLVTAAAQERVAQMNLRQLDPPKWRRAEVKAAEEAGKLAAQGRDMEAALAKRRQLMAAAMFKASVDAQDRIGAIKDYLSTFVTNRRRAALGKAGESYLDAVDQILEAVQLKNVSLKAIDARKSLNEFVKEQEAAGEPVFISDKTRDLLGRKNYSEMTLEELEGIHDAVKNLWTVAKEVNTVRKKQEKIALEQALADIAAEAEKVLPERKRRDHLNPSRIDRMMEGLSRYHAGNLKIEMILDWLGGTAHSLVYQPVSGAAYESWKLHRDLTAPFMEKVRNLPKDQRQRWNTKRQFMNLPMPVTGANIWMAALNLGNAGNKEKLLAGYGWSERELMTELNATLTKEDWDLAQETWDTIEQLWPRIEGVVKRATGLAPPKVEAVPIQTPFGTYRGGYFPVVYDTHIDDRMANKLDSAITPEEMFAKRFTAFVINNGFTKGRTGNVGKLLLSPDVIADHLGEVIHYVTHYDAVKQADRILRAPAFRAMVKARLGDAVYQQMKRWLVDVATNTTQKKGWEFGDAAFRLARSSAQLTALGFNIKSALKQPLGVMTALDALEARHWASGIQAAWLSPKVRENWRFAFAHSKELAPLVKSYDRDLAAISRAYSDKIGQRVWETTYLAAFTPISVMQSVANVAAWHGAYTQGTAKGMSEEEAFDFADKVVRMTQGSGALKDLSGIQRGGEASKFFTMFYSYFSVLYNRLADVQVRQPGAKNLHRKAGRYMVLLLLPELLNSLFDMGWDQMFPPDRKKDDETPFLVRLGLNTMDSTINTLPGVRDLYALTVAAVTGGNPRPPPAFGGVLKVYQGTQALLGLAEGKDLTRSKARNIVGLTGVVTGTPVYGIYRAIDDLFGQAMFEE